MQIFTIGDVAEQLGVPVHRVRYAVESRGIKEAGRAGKARLFGPEEMRKIKLALEDTGVRDGDGQENGRVEPAEIKPVQTAADPPVLPPAPSPEPDDSPPAPPADKAENGRSSALDIPW